MPSNNILLYAKWEINVYTISFDAYDGINIVNFTSNFNESITYPVEPMKNNHGFIGWYLDKDFINAFEMTKVPSEDLNVYARWSILIDRSIIYNNYIYSISFRNSQISMTNNSTNQVEKTISLDGISFPLYAGAKIYENRKLIIDHKSETLMVIGTGKRYQYSYSYFYVVKLDLSLNILSDYTSSHYGGSGIPHAGIRSLNYIEGLFHLTSHYSININQYETFEINKNSFSINPFSNKNFVDISVYSDENLIDGDHDYVRLPTNCFSDCLIYFPTTGINGSDIEWFSTNNNLINPKTGIINISDNASGEVILTAVFRLQNETRTKEFRISLNVD